MLSISQRNYYELECKTRVASAIFEALNLQLVFLQKGKWYLQTSDIS